LLLEKHKDLTITNTKLKESLNAFGRLITILVPQFSLTHKIGLPILKLQLFFFLVKKITQF
jgi:hypothetical protein